MRPWLSQSTFDSWSWIMHNASIQRYLTPNHSANFLTTRTASWNVAGMLWNGILSSKELSKQDLSLKSRPLGPQQWLRVTHCVPFGRSSLRRKRTSEKSLAMPASINREGRESEIENEASVLHPSWDLMQFSSHDLMAFHLILLPSGNLSISVEHDFSRLC